MPTVDSLGESRHPMGMEMSDISPQALTTLVITIAVVFAVRFMPRILSKSNYIKPDELMAKLGQPDAMVVIDVRSAGEFEGALGHIEGAVNLPLTNMSVLLKQKERQLKRYKDQPVCVVCRTDTRSGPAAGMLRKAGFSDTHVLIGGMTRWKRSKLPAVRSET